MQSTIAAEAGRPNFSLSYVPNQLDTYYMQVIRRAIQQAMIKFSTVPLERSERGAAMVEVALLITFIALVAVAAVRVLGEPVSKEFVDVTSGFAR